MSQVNRNIRKTDTFYSESFAGAVNSTVAHGSTHSSLSINTFTSYLFFSQSGKLDLAVQERHCSYCCIIQQGAEGSGLNLVYSTAWGNSQH
jgi:hypothetical protein